MAMTEKAAGLRLSLGTSKPWFWAWVNPHVLPYLTVTLFETTDIFSCQQPQTGTEILQGGSTIMKSQKDPSPTPSNFLENLLNDLLLGDWAIT